MNDRIQSAIDKVVSGDISRVVVHLGGADDNFVQVYNYGDGLKIDAGHGVNPDLAEELGFSKNEVVEVVNSRVANRVSGAGRAIASMVEHISDGTVRYLKEIDNQGEYTNGTPYYF